MPSTADSSSKAQAWIDMSEEIYIDALMGPSHHYAGLSTGNLASQESASKTSSPQAAALEGLEKMRIVFELGATQYLLPPQLRPPLSFLHSLGFKGKEAFTAISRETPALLPYLMSSSHSWMANAATISSSSDTEDAQLHISPANLHEKFHRQLELPQSMYFLKTLFPTARHHKPLTPHPFFGDEGSANQLRFCPQHSSCGLNVFVYGCEPLSSETSSLFPRRQSLLASQAIARRHGLKESLFLQQHPRCIDVGVFHNDVISLSQRSFFLYHPSSFMDAEALPKIQEAYRKLFHQDLYCTQSPPSLSLKAAVESYLFNSQAIDLPDGSICLLVAEQAASHADSYLQSLREDPLCPLTKIIYVSLEQSMNNGGGPACLRLPVRLNKQEKKEIPSAFLFTYDLYEKLVFSIKKHYRAELSPNDLSDPLFLKECQEAFREIYGHFGLTSLL